jgi:NAD(P)-dependent dehydrogenase (short-subunit alcohol dehydrogenase family)
VTAALVTGGGSGIGRATARRLREHGADVVLVDRDAEAVTAAADELGAHALVCDVSDEAAVVSAAAAARRRLGRPADALVNAAGLYRFAPLLEIGADAWDELQAVNLRGTFLMAREVARQLIDAGGGGAIVNLSSIAALGASRDEPDGHYGASKAAIVQLTRQMAVEWGPHGIRANAVCPGMIKTPMLRITDDADVAARFLADAVPLGRFGEADEVAALVCFLLSGDAAYITGAMVPIDGGVTAQ